MEREGGGAEGELVLVRRGPWADLTRFITSVTMQVTFVRCPSFVKASDLPAKVTKFSQLQRRRKRTPVADICGAYAAQTLSRRCNVDKVKITRNYYIYE